VNLQGVESLALDPSDPERLYLACGTYTVPSVPNGAVLRSRDRGRSFERTPLPFKLGANEGGRGNGERLAVDPLDGRVLYLGSRHAGLWRSSDAAASFQRVESFPATAWQRSAADGPPPPWGGSDGRSTIVFVLFDAHGSLPGQPTRTLYVGVSAKGRPNLWRSLDAGASWAPVPGAPQAHRPMRAALTHDGQLYIAYASDPGPNRMDSGAVWRYDSRAGAGEGASAGAWIDITPARPSTSDPFGYGAVAVDRRQPRHLLASTAGRRGGDELYRSTDAGASWQPLFHAGAASADFDVSAAPYVADTPVHWMFDVSIDPHDADHALFSTGYGGWESADLTQADRPAATGSPAQRATHWRVMSRGIEETVALALLSPTRGVPLVTALGDYSGFVHADLDRPAPGNPKPPFLGNTHDVAGAELAPEVMVRIGAPRGGKNLGYSLDGGASWREPASVPDAKASDGALAVSADGRSWVWTPKGSLPHISQDHGATWLPVQGLPRDTRVVADRVNPQRFHAMALFENRWYASVDGGRSFSARPLDLPDGPVARPAVGSHNASGRGDERGGQDRLYAQPGHESRLWLAAFHGLYRRGGEGQGFVRLPGVSEIHAFGFGRAAPKSAETTLYLMGTVNGQYGLFRSTDAAQHWLRINDDAHQWGLVLHVSGDPKVFGRVYVGSHGRGVIYGDPAPQ